LQTGCAARRVWACLSQPRTGDRLSRVPPCGHRRKSAQAAYRPALDASIGSRAVEVEVPYHILAEAPVELLICLE
jgi:hypothetical protein